MKATFKSCDPRAGRAECVTENGVRVSASSWKVVRAALADGCEVGKKVEIELNSRGTVRAMRPAR